MGGFFFVNSLVCAKFAHPEEMDTMVKVVVNLINKNN